MSEDIGLMREALAQISSTRQILRRAEDDLRCSIDYIRSVEEDLGEALPFGLRERMTMYCSELVDHAQRLMVVDDRLSLIVRDTEAGR